MKKLFLIIATTLLAWPASAADVNETMDADPDGHIEIFNTAGSVTVEGWSRASVEVTGTLGNESRSRQSTAVVATRALSRIS
jgi:hypothetical protein